jgi:hypothetical protein
LAKAKGKILLSSPYDLPSNTAIQLINGFGVTIGAASKDAASNSSTHALIRRREIALVVTKKALCSKEWSVVDTSTLTDFTDSFVKELLDDRSFRSLVVGLEDNGDNGLIYFGGENEKEFVQLTKNLTIIYKEVF